MRFFLLLLPLLLNAQMLQVGDNVTPIKLISQHDKEYTLVKNGIWIIAWDKTTTKMLNQYFDEHKMPENLNIIVDTSQIPSGIFSFFVRPSMKNYKHSILLSFDEKYNLTLPFKEDMITLLYIEKTKVKKIIYIKNIEELEKTFK
ncbi:hypothetical protein [Sulfurimonas sp. CS5]|uniref:hypothetical protein n=1 Tax=Sulfurimonas sp. CS5 TaxID=3391145 RepID=UPI0039EC6E76